MKVNSTAKSVMPGNSRSWVAKALKPGAQEPSSTNVGNNKMERFTKRHPAFGDLGARKQQS
jgi:hypothetical protein